MIIDKYIKDRISDFLKRRVIRNNTLYKIFDRTYQCGPLDGGCYSMAAALQRVFGTGQLYTLVGNGIAQHVLLKMGNYYLDADGISTEKALIVRWIKFEGLKTPYLRPFHPFDVPESPRDPNLINMVYKHLTGPNDG